MEYPLGHDAAELERLDAQAQLLHDPFLDKLVAQSSSCLEIGCGNGSNLLLLRRANPDIHYTGIDLSAQAITAAQAKYQHDVDAKFLVMNGAAIDLDSKFDLVFTKLVLWSTGLALQTILREARRLLVSGGTFYALEPCNQLIQLYPPKPLANKWMRAWDEAAIKQGFNPFIGIAMASELVHAGFTHVDSRLVAHIAIGHNSQKYTAIIDNLKGFYMGPAAQKFGVAMAGSSAREEAIAELMEFDGGSLVMDALFAAWGVSP